MPTDQPVNKIDEIFEDIYGPALRDQLNKDLFIQHLIVPGSRPVITPMTRWERIKWWAKWNIRTRINDIYMHTRYGYCDDAKEYDDHIC